MKIKNLKKKITGISAAFILSGAVIGLIGYGMAGFHAGNLEQEGEPRWYQTIHVENGTFWWGVNLGNNNFIITGGR